MLPSVCKVLRDDKITQIHADKLVRGDIVEVHKGEKIPADIRLINCDEMIVDNSSLTGQLEPVLLNSECTHPDNPL
jgi:sodium/potassium-transporting ATPase subunit alpha